MKMMKEYLELGNYISFDNTNMHKILGITLMSQFFKDYKIEYFGGPRSIRLSSFIIAPTRSGKGQATGLMIKCAKNLELNAVTATKFTDAGLVGSLDLEILKENSKKGYRPGDNRYRNPVIYGDLYDKDIIIFNEAKIMIKGGSFAEDTLEILQEATDNEGLIRKKLSAEVAIEFNTSSSIVATTYYLNQLNNILMEQGIFQRLLVLIVEKSFKERQSLNEKIISGINNPKDINDDIISWCNNLKDIKKEKTNKIYKISPLAIQTIKKIVRDYEDALYNNYTGKNFDMLIPFTTAMIEQLCKIGCIFSIIDKSNKKNLVEHTHIQMASNILRISMTSIFRKLSAKVVSSIYEKNIDQNILIYVKKHPGCAKEQLYKYIQEKGFCNRNKVSTITNEMINQNLLKKKKEKSKTSHRPVEALYVNKII